MKYYILILLSLVLSSCGSSYYLSTSTNYDPIYGVTEQGDTLKIDVLDSEFDIRRKLRTDWNFRWNYSFYSTKSTIHLSHNDFYYRNRLWRTGFSSWDFYWNRHDIWWNWAQIFHLITIGDIGIVHGVENLMDSTIQIIGTIDIGLETIGDGIIETIIGIETIEMLFYINGRRGSSNIVVTPNGSRRGNNIINNPNIRINRGRPNPNDVDVVIEKPKRTFIGRVFDKIENSGVRVRTYNNPNSVPNQIRNNTRNNDWNNRVVPRQNNDVIIRNNNNSRPVYTNPRPSTPVRSYSPPPSSNSGRSSGGQ